MNRLAAVLLWSVISAAFIGPGTVATAASSGASFGYSLLWALVFSTVACLVLQEASARLTVISGRNLGQALRDIFPPGPRRLLVLLLVLGAVVLGCAAYEAGNILGGVAGAALAIDLPSSLLAALICLVAASLLWFNSPRRVALLLSLLVAIMGVAFLSTAWLLRPSLSALLRGALVPSLPTGSALIAVGLVGTTVVPYNLFLGSGLARGQELGEMRFGLAVAVGLGGLISMGVVLVGAAIEGPFGFAAIGEVLAGQLGGWAATLFALGLLAAGLSSAVTAPLAAAITARSLFAADEGDAWDDRSWRFRAVWIGVLTVGLVFGASRVQPIPAIVLAQALNGILLPVAAIFLLVAVNDRRLMGASGVNRGASNLAMAAVTAVALLLGTWNVLKAGARAAGAPTPDERVLLLASLVVGVLVAVPVARSVRRRRSGAAAG